MIFLGKYRILQNQITACDYEFVLNEIAQNIKKKKSLLISPIASHTLVLANFDNKLHKILDRHDLLVPDSYWVKEAARFLYGTKLAKRVYGPTLMLKTCQLAENNKFKIFLYGATEKTILKLKKKLLTKFSHLKLVAGEPSKFRELLQSDWDRLIQKIISSKSQIIFVGLGSPLQEIFSHKLMRKLQDKKINLVIISIGAAFNFISGVSSQAPSWMQDMGLEWLFRFSQEPRRLWKRYFIDGIVFLILVLLQKISFLFDFAHIKIPKIKVWGD